MYETKQRPDSGERLGQARVGSAAVLGVDARPIEIEVDRARGLSQTILVGLRDRSARECRDRVRAAIRRAGFEYPSSCRLTINLAPASLRKDGALYDLPIAIGVLLATEQLPEAAAARARTAWLVGELALDARLRPVRGLLPIAGAARTRGPGTLVVPWECAAEAGLVERLTVVGCRDLGEVVAWLATGEAPTLPPPAVADPGEVLDLRDVVGQRLAKYALQVAAAGGHHLLMSGPPGVGKTMLASRLPGLLGPLPDREALEVSRVYSVGGMLDARRGLIRQPPFRAPHHTISEAALIGGGQPLRPGEVSLAHRGVLFLDEAPEFGRRALDALRQPLEAHRVEVARVGGRATYPARFQLVLAMNPCPCGWYGASVDRCRCVQAEVERYQRRLSGALLDRVDVQVDLEAVDPDALCAALAGEPGGPEGATEALREPVLRARRAQMARYGGGVLNAMVPDALFRRHCTIASAARVVLQEHAARGALSARGAARVLRVARTIADLEGRARIEGGDVLQALMLRRRVGSR